MERYADIVLPLAQPAYTYAVADGLDVEEGQAVAVQFGARRIYTGIVWRIHGRRPDFPRIKTVSRVLYDRPLLDARQRALWEWMADYYLCTLGEVMRFALPQTIKPSGNSEQEFADREYRPRTELYAALDASLHDEERFHDLMERLSRRAPRQYAALLAIASAEGGDRISTGEVPRRLLEADAATLAALQRRASSRSPAANGASNAAACGSSFRHSHRPNRAASIRSAATSTPDAAPCCCTASPVRARPSSTST